MFWEFSNLFNIMSSEDCTEFMLFFSDAEIKKVFLDRGGFKCLGLDGILVYFFYKMCLIIS